MDLKPISNKLTLSEQLHLSDIASVAEQGYRSIICNRPDGEGADQPTFVEIKKAAESLGMEVRYQPVVPGQINDEDVATFSQSMRELPKPTLAFCRTGTRSATLWSLSQADNMLIPDILSASQAAGYDMS